MHGGPADGLPLSFVVEDGEAVTVRGGGLELHRQPEPAGGLDHFPPRLLPPPMSMDEHKRAAFDDFWQRLQQAGGAHVAYDLPYPKHEFLRYLAGLDQVIFHGSGDPEIDRFVPLRRSYELRDETGRGNQEAVYGTHDGLWPLFFAIVDRERISGSIRNGVAYFYNAEGQQLATYHFSINETWLPRQPWRTGTLYILPRDTFRRLEMAPGVLSNEWASHEPVLPLARLSIEPADFPFLDQIAGHDDTPLIRAGELTARLRAAVTDVDLNEGTLRATLGWSAEIGSALVEYVALQREQVPLANFTITFRARRGPVELMVDGPAPYLSTLRRSLTPQ
jgi:hypothetical protein